MKMRKRFFASMALLTAGSLVVLAAMFCLIFYYQLLEAAQNEVRERAFVLRELVRAGTPYTDMRMTDMGLRVVTGDGTVIYNGQGEATETSEAQERLAWGDCAEVRQAVESGTGESKRFSDTLQQEVYCFAVKLDDGTVLHLAKTTRSVWGLFSHSLPFVVGVLVLMLVLEYLLAQRLARRLVAPIGQVDLKKGLSAPYDEFAPYVLELERQQNRIEKHKDDLRERADTITAIMDNMSEGVILVDSGGMVLSVNQSAADIFAVEPPAEGRNILEIVRDVTFLQNVRSALAGTRGEMSLEQASRLYQVFMSPGRDSGAIILFLDVTEKAFAEKQRRDFSANVSHELKTPLTTIYGHAEMLAGGMVGEGDEEGFYDRIRQEAAHLLSLIDDIMKISQLDEGVGQELWEDVDLGVPAAEAVIALREKAAAHDVEVLLESGEATIKANRLQMYELFLNLIDNAIAYNRPNGKVHVTISSEDGRARLVVADTGIGIPLEDQSRVFERFFRVDKSRSKKTGGTGLGLAIVKHIVSAHRGVISLQSREHEGTVIEVVFSVDG
ncbi:MAG: ATP-binding protein [Peptococcaceae bacterium]|nr:ATP-binding protein [Peptococcaceae bacterium]